MRLVGLQDKGEVVAPGSVDLRFVQAAANAGTVVMGTGALAGGFKPLDSGVSFGGAATTAEAQAASPIGVGVVPIVVDDAGYVQLGPSPNVTVSVHAEVGSLNIDDARRAHARRGRAIVTIVLVPELSSSASTQLLECVDNSRVLRPI